jgi:hypothetical protein
MVEEDLSQAEISMAQWCLILDELPERDVLEVMRQPLEDREVTISREVYGNLSIFFMLVTKYEPQSKRFLMILMLRKPLLLMKCNGI